MSSHTIRIRDQRQAPARGCANDLPHISGVSAYFVGRQIEEQSQMLMTGPGDSRRMA